MVVEPDRCGELIVTPAGSVRCAYPKDHPTTKDGKPDHYACVAHIEGKCLPGHWTND